MEALTSIKSRFTFSFSQICLTMVGMFFTTMIILNHIYPKVSYYNNLKISYIILALITAVVSGFIFYAMFENAGSNKDIAVFYNKYITIWEGSLLGIVIPAFMNILIAMATGMWVVLGSSLALIVPYTVFVIIGNYSMVYSLANAAGESK